MDGSRLGSRCGECHIPSGGGELIGLRVGMRSCQDDAMPRLRLRVMVALLSTLTCVLAGCGPGDDGSSHGRRPPGAHVTIRVPAEAPTISAAVSLAHPGDLVLVAPGVYHES